MAAVDLDLKGLPCRLRPFCAHLAQNVLIESQGCLHASTRICDVYLPRLIGDKNEQ